MRKVIIATPAMDGRVEGIFAYSLAETVRLGMTSGIYFQPLIVMHDALIEQIRDDLFAMVYGHDVSDVLWVDGDLSWEPTQALRLLSHNVDVVGGTYRRKEDVETYVVKCQPSRLHAGANGLIEVDALGCGFLRMSRMAMDYLWDASAPYIGKSGAARRRVFELLLSGDRLVSEDVSVCLKLRQGGFQVYLDPTITCTHKGAKAWVGDFASWMHQFHAAMRQPAQACG
jgi:hypothetical protein